MHSQGNVMKFSLINIPNYSNSSRSHHKDMKNLYILTSNTHNKHKIRKDIGERMPKKDCKNQQNKCKRQRDNRKIYQNEFWLRLLP
jgi:hypothetical protein